jgi:hypothetical protein
MPQSSDEKLRIAERRHRKLTRRQRRGTTAHLITVGWFVDIEQPLQWRCVRLPWLSARKLRIACRRGYTCRVTDTGGIEITGIDDSDQAVSRRLMRQMITWLEKNCE